MSLNYDVEKNIANAFKIVYKTYENAQKLMSFLRGAANSHHYRCLTDNPLTWSQTSNLNNDHYGWAYGRFVMIFQKNKKENNNNLHENSLFVFCLNLGYFHSDFEREIEEDNEIAKIYLARFDYGKSKLPEEPYRNRDLWMYDRPILWNSIMDYSIEAEYSYGTREADENYGGLEQVIKCFVPLSDIKSSDDAKKMIFGKYDELQNLPVK